MPNERRPGIGIGLTLLWITCLAVPLAFLDWGLAVLLYGECESTDCGAGGTIVRGATWPLIVVAALGVMASLAFGGYKLQRRHSPPGPGSG